MSTPAMRRRWDRWYALALLAATVALGGLVLFKSVYLTHPQGDFGSFARAGWAIRQGGEPLYHVRDNHTWHYIYPPLFAICMTPFADPPRQQTALTTATVVGLSASPTPCSPLLAASVIPANGTPFVEDTGIYLPFSVSIALFYLFSVAILFVAVRWLGSTVEEMMPAPLDEAAAYHRWWTLRLLPVLACIMPIGLTLVRGQVQSLLLLFLAGFLIGLVRGRRFSAGLWLSAAIAMKLFPAFLLIAPLIRRDLRCLLGCAVGLLVGLVLIPVVVMGPSRTLSVYKTYSTVLLEPAMGISTDSLLQKELLNAGATQSQSFQVILHKIIHLASANVPPKPAAWLELVHLLIGATMTFALVWGKDGLPNATGRALFARLALLLLVTVMMSPVCHLHYFTVAVPLFMIVRSRMEAVGSWRGYWLWFGLSMVFVLAQSMPMLPGLLVLRNVGVPLLATLACWVAGLVYFWREPVPVGRPEAFGVAA